MKTNLQVLRGGARCPQRAGSSGTGVPAVNYESAASAVPASALGSTRSTAVSGLLALACLFLLVVTPAQAQWQTINYTLHGGWNSIYLHGDASYATIEQQLANNPEVLSIWRWNPNPTATQFGGAGLIPLAGTPEWSTWYKPVATPDTLSALIGQSAYLVECTGTITDTYQLSITQRVLPPASKWVRSGANFLGFPARVSSPPTIANYFATFPSAVAANTKIYKYVGGPLDASNPVQVFSPSFEPLDRTQAYWFDATVVSDFYAPLEITPSNLAGLVYGRNGSQVTVRVRNRSSATVTLTVTPTASATAPVGQDQWTAAVPLTRRTFNSGTNSYDFIEVTAPFTVVLAPQASSELVFGVKRESITGPDNSLYASLLRFTESSNLLEVLLPVSARVTSLAGLWVGDVAVTNVESKAVGFTGTATKSPYPLRVLLHVDDAGTARVLSQVFLGRLAPAPYAPGIATKEAHLKADEKANAQRFVATHLPLDQVLATGTGSVALGQTLVRTVEILANAPTNPYVHTYHPDHDNKDSRFALLPTTSAGTLESPTIGRTLSFTFSPTPLPTSSPLGWGSTVLGGTYAETITGVHKDPLTVSGTFELRRVSELGSITTN